VPTTGSLGSSFLYGLHPDGMELHRNAHVPAAFLRLLPFVMGISVSSLRRLKISNLRARFFFESTYILLYRISLDCRPTPVTSILEPRSASALSMSSGTSRTPSVSPLPHKLEFDPAIALPDLGVRYRLEPVYNPSGLTVGIVRESTGIWSFCLPSGYQVTEARRKVTAKIGI
jgi:hypothetical protein